MVSGKVHNELLQIADERAFRAETRVKELEQMVRTTELENMINGPMASCYGFLDSVDHVSDSCSLCTVNPSVVSKYNVIKIIIFKISDC